jgi:hypothetical protein
VAARVIPQDLEMIKEVRYLRRPHAMVTAQRM